jgi:drug/metabolite transporter (DMT)-like permease
VPILLALVSALVYGVADWCGGRSARTLPAAVVTLVGQSLSLVLVVLCLAVLGTPLAPWRDLAWGAGGGLIACAGLMTFYYALASGAMTVVAPVTAVVSAALPVAVGLILGERPRPIAYAGIAIAVVAVALVSGIAGARGQHVAPRIVVMAALAGIGFGSLYVAFSRTASASGMWPLLAARVAAIPMLTVVVLRIGSLAALRERPPPRLVWRLPAVAGVLDMTANGLYLWASHLGLLTIVAVVGSLYPVSTIILAAAVDDERLHRAQWVGIALALLALAMVTAGRSH